MRIVNWSAFRLGLGSDKLAIRIHIQYTFGKIRLNLGIPTSYYLVIRGCYLYVQTGTGTNDHRAIDETRSFKKQELNL